MGFEPQLAVLMLVGLALRLLAGLVDPGLQPAQLPLVGVDPLLPAQWLLLQPRLPDELSSQPLSCTFDLQLQPPS